MAAEDRFVGPHGAVFVLAPGVVDERTLAARLESGEWKRYEEPEQKRPGRPRKTD